MSLLGDGPKTGRERDFTDNLIRANVANHNELDGSHCLQSKRS
jgi:hypothetical protein